MENGKTLKRANPSTIHDKFLVGYQGWFTCAGDGKPIDPGHHGWLHWFNYPIPDGGKPTIDPWPDVSEYHSSELYPAPGLKHKTGEQAFLFSSRNPKTVQRHFHWMAQHGIDGVFLQRFAGQCDIENGNTGIRRLRDEVGDCVKDAAEKEGRVFTIMYDVSGVPADRIARVLESDWNHLLHDKRILESPNYLREKGKPVVALWGFGFEGRNHTPALVRHIVDSIRSITPGGAYVMAGTPTYWRTATEDADRNPEFLDVWLNDFDAISPWMVGRLRNNQDVENFAEFKMKADIDLLKKRHEEGKRKVDYLPVVYPGFSGFNLKDGRWGFNDIKREGGRFLWKQIFSAKRLGVRSMYGAMWDEYDEGTALIPVVEKARLLPDGGKFPFLALDADGYDIPADWYMRICGFAAEGLRSERMIHESFPSKELQDYWSSRPRYEDMNKIDGDPEDKVAGSSRQAYEEWLGTQKESKDEPPPPPYSLEAEEVQIGAPSESTDTSSTVPSTSSPQPAPFSSNPIPAAISSISNLQQSPGPALNSHPSTPQPQVQATTDQPANMTTLADDFARHRISSPSSPAPLQSPIIAAASSVPSFNPPHASALAATMSISANVRPPLSPPPQHPSSRPRPNLATRPPSTRPRPPSQTSRPSSRPNPPEVNRPSSQTSSRPEVSGFVDFPQGPQFPSPEAQPLTQPHWPPPEWGVNQPQSQHTHHRPPPPAQQPFYQGDDYRPHLTHTPTPPLSSSHFGPTEPTSFQQENLSQSPIFFPQAAINSVGPSPVMNSYSSSPSSTFPSSVPVPPRNQNHYPFPSEPHAPYALQHTFGSSSQSPCSTNASYPPYTHQTPQGPPSNSSFLQAPVNEPGSSYHHGPSYPIGPPNNDNNHYGGYRPSYTQPSPTPTPGIGPMPGSWVPPSEGYHRHQPSQVLPRPTSAAPGPYQAGNGFNNHNSNANYPSPSSSSSAPFAGSSAFGYALSAVNKVAGRNTRDQLESLAQTGGKLLSKFK
ncbi:hypothetical protein E1B28_009678 [Marasmius oreades]|uniref:Xylosidase/arabinosidase n=1 Tax=Marasmius oreades TaxID=181124 RepID=A0A9P7URY1_9AGAR|nr:uncharacterized protein E1B28_009678 [Marasmius oreades]KAG7090571.1 hypothetical protein E1B28_009678 [Marasmius oreades]